MAQSNRRLGWLLVVFLLLACTGGCVRRRLVVRTNPPGAAIYVDNQFIGNSPAATSVTYYGTRNITAVADGYQTAKVLRKISPPWYQLPPLDFLTETLWPWEIRDERIFDMTLIQETLTPSDELLARGNSLRMQAAQGLATGLPPTAGGITQPGTFQPGTISPGGVYPTQPIPSPPREVLPPWRPGQLLREFWQPGGQPVQRIPETSGVSGGGYRPEIGN